MKNLDVTAILSATLIGVIVGASADYAVPDGNEASSLSFDIEIEGDTAGGIGKRANAARLNRGLEGAGVTGEESERGSNDTADIDPVGR